MTRRKRVPQCDGTGEEKVVEFSKIDALACPFCREEALWRDHDLSPPTPGEERKLSFTAYLCENCGMTFGITLVDPDLDVEHNRTNLERFRAAPELSR